MNSMEDRKSVASKLFSEFCSAATFLSTLEKFRHLCDTCEIDPNSNSLIYKQLQKGLLKGSWKADSLFSKYDKLASLAIHENGRACKNTQALVIGAGPCGLRAAIALRLMGSRVVVLEMRDRFSRNNVLHLWPFLIADLKQLGAKRFHGKFCAGSIDHISIRALQRILLKCCLLLGVEIHPACKFTGLVEPTDQEKGWRISCTPEDHVITHYEFDVLLGADGSRNTLSGFTRVEFRGKLAIAITANFRNNNSTEEASVPEISGVAFIFNQQFFKNLKSKTDIDLENIVYYKDDTHYFVMTAKKSSLLKKEVIREDSDDPVTLLARSNVDNGKLKAFAMEAAFNSTDGLLNNLEFAENHYAQSDVAMFDFTSMYHSETACRVIERKRHKLLIALVGDSLLEPFWPMGTGCARGFMGVMDTAWMVKMWASCRYTALEVMAQRESVYQYLSQTTPENTVKHYAGYTCDPATRYINLNLHYVLPHQVKHQYNADDKTHLNEIVAISEKTAKQYEWLRDREHLLKWLHHQLQPYKRLTAQTSTSSKDSNLSCNTASSDPALALCCLVHLYRPDTIDVYEIDIKNSLQNCEKLFTIGETQFQIPRPQLSTEKFLDACYTRSNEVSFEFIAYLSKLYAYFKSSRSAVRPRHAVNEEHAHSTTSAASTNTTASANTLNVNNNNNNTSRGANAAVRKRRGYCVRNFV